MSVTRQEPVRAAMVQAADPERVLGDPSHYDGENPPDAGREAVPLRELMDNRLLDALLERSRDEAGGLRLTGAGSMLGELVKAVLERALDAELTAHLGYERRERAGYNSGNSRNGTIAKKVQTGIGPVGLEVPRDRAGSFEPVLIPKRSGRVSGGLDDMIISLYAHGMTVRDILHHLEQVYGTKLSHEQVSRITDQVLEEVRAWQDRPLDPVYAVVFLDAIMVKVRDNHVVQNKPACIAIGVDADGEKHVLVIWLAKTPPESATAGESGRFWASVTAGLRNRGVRDILIACCDGLAGFEDAITAAFPAAPPVRKLLYTTNSIESLNYQLRKVTKARGHFPSDDAVVKLLWLAIINIEDKRARERAARRHRTNRINKTSRQAKRSYTPEVTSSASCA
jgi:putative transposase